MNEYTAFNCKSCGELSPVGVGYINCMATKEQSEVSNTIDRCPCGYSVHAKAINA